MNDSPFLAIKHLETQIIGILRGFDLYGMEGDHRKAVKVLKRELADARLDIRDYELSETREEQLENAKEAKKRLEQIRKHILAASEYNVFTAIDVAQFSAELEQIIENVR
jgi:hypothetical protein